MPQAQLVRIHLSREKRLQVLTLGVSTLTNYGLTQNKLERAVTGRVAVRLRLGARLGGRRAGSGLRSRPDSKVPPPAASGRSRLCAVCEDRVRLSDGSQGNRSTVLGAFALAPWALRSPSRAGAPAGNRRPADAWEGARHLRSRI